MGNLPGVAATQQKCGYVRSVSSSATILLQVQKMSGVWRISCQRLNNTVSGLVMKPITACAGAHQQNNLIKTSRLQCIV